MILKETMTVTTAGSAGSAAGTAYSKNVLTGYVHAAYIDFDTACPATTDVTLAAGHAPTESILSLLNGTVDKWVYPRRALHDYLGSAIYYEAAGSAPIYDRYMVVDHVSVIVAGCDAITDAVAITLFWEE